MVKIHPFCGKLGKSIFYKIDMLFNIYSLTKVHFKIVRLFPQKIFTYRWPGCFLTIVLLTDGHVVSSENICLQMVRLFPQKIFAYRCPGCFLTIVLLTDGQAVSSENNCLQMVILFP